MHDVKLIRDDPEGFARALPASALTECVRAALVWGAALPGRALVTLLAWTVAAPVAAAATFRWE